MNKLIYKTALFTFLTFLATLFVGWSVLAYVSPITASNVTAYMGFKGLTLSYTEAEYQRTQDINCLATLIDRSIIYNDYKRTEKYCDIITAKSNFSKFAEGKDSADKNNANLSGGYKDYIYGNFAIAKYVLSGDYTSAINTASKVLDENYKTNNALTYLVMYFYRSSTNILKNENFGNALVTTIQVYSAALQDKLQGVTGSEKERIEAEIKNADMDLVLVYSALGQTDNVNDILNKYA